MIDHVIIWMIMRILMIMLCLAMQPIIHPDILMSTSQWDVSIHYSTNTVEQCATNLQMMILTISFSVPTPAPPVLCHRSPLPLSCATGPHPTPCLVGDTPSIVDPNPIVYSYADLIRR